MVTHRHATGMRSSLRSMALKILGTKAGGLNKMAAYHGILFAGQPRNFLQSTSQWRAHDVWMRLLRALAVAVLFSTATFAQVQPDAITSEAQRLSQQLKQVKDDDPDWKDSKPQIAAYIE